MSTKKRKESIKVFQALYDCNSLLDHDVWETIYFFSASTWCDRKHARAFTRFLVRVELFVGFPSAPGTVIKWSSVNCTKLCHEIHSLKWTPSFYSIIYFVVFIYLLFCFFFEKILWKKILIDFFGLYSSTNLCVFKWNSTGSDSSLLSWWKWAEHRE